MSGRKRQAREGHCKEAQESTEVNAGPVSIFLFLPLPPPKQESIEVQ